MKSNITVTTSESNPEAATPLGHSMYQQLSQKEKAAKQKEELQHEKDEQAAMILKEHENDKHQKRLLSVLKNIGNDKEVNDDLIESIIELGFLPAKYKPASKQKAQSNKKLT